MAASRRLGRGRGARRGRASALEERDGVRVRRFRLSLADGTVLDVSRDEPDGMWRIERELIGE